MKAGFQSVYQTKKNLITTKSIQVFSRQADKTFTSINKRKQPKCIPDLFETGWKKLQDIFKTEYVHSSCSRFLWGSTLSHGIPDENPENQDADKEPTKGLLACLFVTD